MSQSSDSGFLAGASPQLREVMASFARPRDLSEGEELFAQGDKGDALYAVIEGMLEISIISADGRKLCLDVMREGAIVGEIALFDPGPRTATVTALSASIVWGIRNADIMAALRDTPALGADMLALAGRRMRWMGQQLSEQVFLTMPARLARKILYLTATSGGSEPQLHMSQMELAEFVGASREAVARTLALWKREEIIVPERRGLRILDRPALTGIAAFPKT
ncbi:Crp/Fnr family transcriptional regulator [Sulfitobacter aestuarii]|uniref:Crp/Fnr family transcriptional regulator n=1 Tax=Sulfitobacter aestuarii TaxID=2161676 RepID=A0ABW5TXC6_9RHOB